MIRAIVFDWGGVIQRTVDERPRRALEIELGLPHGTIDGAVFDSPAWDRISRGHGSATAAWAEILAAVRCPEDEMRAFIRQFFSGDRLDERLLQLIRDLRARGLKVGLLSNAPTPLEASPSEPAGQPPPAQWGMDGLFDAQVFSYQVGALKPAPRTYRAILDALGIPAAEALFVDDTAANVEGARVVGMDAIRFETTKALLDELATRQIPLSRDEQPARPTD